MGQKKDVDKLLSQVRREGWTTKLTGQNHWKCMSPDGQHIVYVPGTPGGGRAYLNARATFRRLGVDV